MATAKEKVKPPSKQLTKKAAKKLPEGDPLAGRVMAEREVAVKQGIINSARRAAAKKSR